MQIVIDIPKEYYKNLLNDNKFSSEEIPIVSLAVVSGIPLPQNHGDLKDMNDLCPKSNYGCKNCDYLHTCNFYSTPTIVKADNEKE